MKKRHQRQKIEMANFLSLDTCAYWHALIELVFSLPLGAIFAV